jgi:hypothetical protein
MTPTSCAFPFVLAQIAAEFEKAITAKAQLFEAVK